MIKTILKIKSLITIYWILFGSIVSYVKIVKIHNWNLKILFLIWLKTLTNFFNEVEFCV